MSDEKEEVEQQFFLLTLYGFLADTPQNQDYLRYPFIYPISIPGVGAPGIVTEVAIRICLAGRIGAIREIVLQ